MLDTNRDIMLVPISIKSSFDDDNYILDMLAAVYNTPDLGRDRILPGAFSKTLREKGNQRSILWQHQIENPIGKGNFSDTTKGLACKCYLPKSDTLVTGRVIPQVNVGSIGGASIGYQTQEADYNTQLNCRDLKTIDLYETSLVTIPMHPGAQILSVTKAAHNMGVCEFKGMDKNLKNYIYTLQESLEDKTDKTEMLSTMDDKTPWDETKSLKEIKEHNGGVECYLGESPIAYFIEGKFKAVPKGVYASAAKSIDSDNAEIKSRINEYYKKLGRDCPFKDGKSFIDVDVLKYLSRKQLAAILEGDENKEMSKSAREFLVDCFRGQEPDPRSNETKNSPVMDEFLKNLKLLQTI